MPPPPLHVIGTGPGDPAFNMALDEVLLIEAGTRPEVVLRFYGWTEPAATFGYSQRWADVAAATRLRPIIRRTTGGGIVPHDHDWTYSLTVPPAHAWYGLRAVESYEAMHAWVVRAFAGVGIAAELAPCCRKVAPGQCFQGWEKFDVLWGGRKIGGAAQRRNRLGLLIQGSVQPPTVPGLTRAGWEDAMTRTAPADFFPESRREPLSAALQERARELARSKYSDPGYLESR